MRLSVKHSGSKDFFYVLGNATKNGKSTSMIIEKLGTAEEIKEKQHCSDPVAWAKEYVAGLNREKKEREHKVLIPLCGDARLPLDRRNSFNIGYLFLQQIYHQLRLPNICRNISKEHGFTYDLDSILSRLVYGRILYPSSKLSCFEQSEKLFEQPWFELQHVYRALSVIAEDSDYIQSQLYRNSLGLIGRSTGILYYDCTNYFFETEMEEGIRKYGPSKEHRPNPIVQMGLFMDRSGIPLAFDIRSGNENEQASLRPIEERIMKDFELSRFVVCTDAGLSSNANRMFNNFGERSFITTQSVKTLPKALKEWALSPKGWHLEGSTKTYDISALKDGAADKDLIFYKQRMIEGFDRERDIAFDQNLIVTFSLKYKDYQSRIRSQQIERAQRAMEKPAMIEKARPNDYKRLIRRTAVTSDGEIADGRQYELNLETIGKEAMYDGFYAVCTNLDDDPADIARINRGRWEIEESFRIMKTEFRARPVYLKRDDRIRAHFTTCFIALLIYRILEKKLGGKYTCGDIISALREMDVTRLGEDGYAPSYTRTELTDSLHEMAGFRTDYEFSTGKGMKGICRRSKGL
jgi:transposase